MTEKRRVTAVIPCNDLAASEAFYGLLGFHRHPDGVDYGDYIILTDDGGADIHILETGNDSFRFKHSSAHEPKTAKEKRKSLTTKADTNDT